MSVSKNLEDRKQAGFARLRRDRLREDLTDRHLRCAVYQDVQWLAGGKKPLSEGIDRGWVDQVHRLDLDTVESLQRGRGLVVISRRDDDTGACGTQRSRGLQTDAGIAAGDDCDAAGQVEALDNVAGSGSGVEAGIDGFLQSGYCTYLLSLTCSKCSVRSAFRTMNA